MLITVFKNFALAKILDKLVLENEKSKNKIPIATNIIMPIA